MDLGHTGPNFSRLSTFLGYFSFSFGSHNLGLYVSFGFGSYNFGLILILVMVDILLGNEVPNCLAI